MTAAIMSVGEETFAHDCALIISVWWIVCRIMQVCILCGQKACVCVSLSECLYVFMFSMWAMCMSVGTATALYKGLLLVQSQSAQNAIVIVYNKGQRFCS